LTFCLGWGAGVFYADYGCVIKPKSGAKKGGKAGVKVVQVARSGMK